MPQLCTGHLRRTEPGLGRRVSRTHTVPAALEANGATKQTHTDQYQLGRGLPEKSAWFVSPEVEEESRRASRHHKGEDSGQAHFLAEQWVFAKHLRNK